MASETPPHSRSPEILPVVIRADANEEIGTGHITRCAVLTQALLRQGVPVLFACRSLPYIMQAQLEALGAEVQHLDARDEIEGMSSITRRALAVVFDHYGIGPEVEASVRNEGVPVMSIDDMFTPHHCDIVLNQNLYAHADHYAGKVIEGCLILSGWDHALLRDEFRGIPKRARSRPEPGRARILVTMGGADTPNTTGRAIAALGRLHGRIRSAEVIVGPSNPHRSALEEAAAASPTPIAVLSHVRDMARRMCRADLAVCAGGTTHLELMATGLPSVMVSLADNQDRVCDHMAREGLTSFIGDHTQLDEGKLAEAIAELLEHPTRYADMCSKLSRFEEPRGAARVARALRTYVFRDPSLRPISRSDLMGVFRLSNDPVVRAASLHSEPIPLPDHRAWFEKRIEELDSPWYAIRCAGGDFIGQLRLDRKGPADRCYLVGISLIEPARGLGLGRLVLQRAVREALVGTGAWRLEARVRVDNIASYRSFIAAGFSDEGIHSERGQQVHRLSLQGD
jgi:UDP-2,4-diacetamido-2,4,6-trideoxy-beta-L-altropyranose hydrolase